MTDDYRLLIRATGGPEVIERESIEVPDPGEGEIRVRHGAIGLNFIDTYHRIGLYPIDLPSGLGREAAGVVEAVGPGVDGIRPGDRIGYADGPSGSYATVRLLPAHLAIRLPGDVDDRTAAAALLKGLTADMLVGPCGRVHGGQTILVHAAAGGVGSLLVPWLKAVGAVVIAHAGSDEKAAKARAAGADHALSCPFDVLPDAVRDITGGRGVDTVMDGVGKASWAASLASLRPRGLMISYGNASGAVPPFDPLTLTRGGSLFVTRPTLSHYLATPEERAAASERLFAMLASGTVAVEIGQTFALSDASDAHRALEARKTTGSTILLPYETRPGRI
jgi:NADPH:quinone reductase